MERKQAYDLFSQTFKTNPFPTFKIMRHQDPIFAHKAPDGRTIWYITQYEDVVDVLKENKIFVKDIRNASTSTQTPNAKSSIQRLINENMLFADPPDHTRLRALVNQAFTPRRIQSMAPRIEEIASQLIHNVLEQKKMDIISDYALPIPLTVITELLGIPQADRDAVCDMSQAIISPGSRGLTYRARKQKVRAFIAYLQELFQAREKHPQDDLITDLVQAETNGDRLSQPELSSMVALLIVTGHETTVNLIGNGMYALLTHPDQLGKLKANLSLLPETVEEILRYDGPVETSTTRWVSEDIIYKGHHMKKGDVMRVVITSANRDQAQFTDADMFDIGRKGNGRQHLSFGFGIHYCLGAPLARLEGQIAFHQLLSHLPSIRLAVPPNQLKWRSGVLFRSLEALPVIW